MFLPSHQTLSDVRNNTRRSEKGGKKVRKETELHIKKTAAEEDKITTMLLYYSSRTETLNFLRKRKHRTLSFGEAAAAAERGGS